MKTLVAVCDLQYCPVSYDFIAWLRRARLEQRRRGAEGLHVVLMPYTEGLGGFARDWGGHDVEMTDWKLWNVVIPACRLAGATVTLADGNAAPPNDSIPAVWWPQGKAHFLKPLVEAHRNGEKIPLLSASPQALRWAKEWTAERKVVTLTLRENNALDGRDSNLSAWLEFALWLKESGYSPILLEDTARVLKLPSGQFAALSIDLRLALYQCATMNCVGHNGPACLMWHSNAPYLNFCAAHPLEDWAKHWPQFVGLEVGEQMPWARADQRMIYRPDDFEVMVEEFEKYEQSLLAPQGI